MNRFAKHIVIFLLPITCVLGLMEYGMRSVPNDYSYKHSRLDSSISRIRIWSFGSSHGLAGIRPEVFSLPAFNSAHVSQTLPYDAFLFDKYIDRVDALEWVILPISYFTFTDCLEEEYEWWRIKNYCLYYDCPLHRNDIHYRSEIIGNPMPLYQQVGRITRYLISGTDDIRCDSLGFDLHYCRERREPNWYMNGEERVRVNTKDLTRAQHCIMANKHSLEHIIDACAARNVKVLLLTLPVCSTFYSNVDSAQQALVTETCNDLADRYSHVLYLDMLRDERFTEEDFFDADHLVTSGANKLTRILDEYIRLHSLPFNE